MFLTFPHQADPSHNEVPIWMNFYGAPYGTFSSSRTRSAIVNNAYVNINLPFPTQLNTLNKVIYSNGASKNTMSMDFIARDGLVKGLARQGSEVATGLIEKATTFLTGGNVLTFDHMESVLSPGGRRTHLFDYTLISKTEASARAANEIALLFQANMHPIADTASIYTMRHPFLWYFVTEQVGRYFDGDPMVSVLESVDVNRVPLQNIPYYINSGDPEKIPLALNIKLSFLELEPAFKPSTTGSNTLINRSERVIGGSGIGWRRPQGGRI